MFTGIITDIGKIAKIEQGTALKRLTIECAYNTQEIDIGASIACDGCCLTVVELNDNAFVIEAAPETLDLTTVGEWQQGTKINLERSLKAGDELGGHIVSGHVDEKGVLETITSEGESYRLVFSVPESIAKFIAPKGSIAINGISLTVNEVDGNRFGVCIIPHTWDVTAISTLNEGDLVNIEVDMLARYVARILGAENKVSGKQAA